MRKIGLGLIIAYQKLTFWMPPSCRYTPSCSRYTYQAIERFGLGHPPGGLLGNILKKRATNYNILACTLARLESEP